MDVKKLRIFDPERETGFLMEALRRTIKHAGPEVPVLGFAASPWTLACYMVEGRTKEGFATVKSFLYREPKVFRDLLQKISKATILYLKGQIAAGVSAVQLFDTWCGELNLADYTEFVLPAVQEIIAGLGGVVPVIYYTKASHHLLPSIVKAGANVLSVDWRVSLKEIRTLAGSRVALQGNLDPAVLLGPKEKIRQATLDIVDELGGVGHILNLGHGILATHIRGKRSAVHPHRPASRAQRCQPGGTVALLSAQEVRAVPIINPTLREMRQELSVDEEFVNRYNRPGPRYTSYPTAPVWTDSFGPNEYETAIAVGRPEALPSFPVHAPALL